MRTATGAAAIILCVTVLALWAPHSAAAARTHVVQPGENLFRIALRYGVTVDVLARANGIVDPARIRAGQVLIIPGPPPVIGSRPVNAPPPIIAPPPVIGTNVLAAKPLRIRGGPKSYFVTVALVAADTVLRIVSEEDNWYEVGLPDGSTGWVPRNDLRAVEPRPVPVERVVVRGGDIVREAMRYLGTPYVWGGGSGRGLDCSGFVYVVMSSQLPALTRMSSFEYWETGTAISRMMLLPGDLLFFTTYAPGPSHVGIYTGENRFVHASSGARRVILSSLDEPYYGARYLGARRLVTP